MPDTRVNLIDSTYYPTLDHIDSEFQKHPADVAGIFMDTLMYQDALDAAEIAKKHSAFTIVGGPHPTILPDTVIENSNVDAICIGEGEETFAEVVQALSNNAPLDAIRGIWFKRNGHVVKNSPRAPIEDLDRLPFPDIEIFDVERYIQNFIQLDSFTTNLRGMSVIVSRGCPFQCSYCQPVLTEIFGKRFRIRSPKNVAKELKVLRTKYNLDAVYFQDDTLTVSKQWMSDFCDAMLDTEVNLKWACNTRADLMDPETLSKMKSAGLVKLKVGIESINDRIRNGIYKKKVTRDQIKNLIDMTKKTGIQLTGFFMLGAPGETRREMLQTIKFAANSGLTEANFSVTVPLPQTGLYAYAREKGATMPDCFGDYDYYHAVRPAMLEGDIAPKRLELLKKIAYLSFYFHPKRFVHTMKTICGLKGFMKLIQKLKRF